MTIIMIRLGSAITASLKPVYTVEYVKIAMMNISQNFGPEKIINGINPKKFKERPRIRATE